MKHFEGDSHIRMTFSVGRLYLVSDLGKASLLTHGSHVIELLLSSFISHSLLGVDRKSPEKTYVPPQMVCRQEKLPTFHFFQLCYQVRKLAPKAKNMSSSMRPRPPLQYLDGIVLFGPLVLLRTHTFTLMLLTQTTRTCWPIMRMLKRSNGMQYRWLNCRSTV